MRWEGEGSKYLHRVRCVTVEWSPRMLSLALVVDLDVIDVILFEFFYKETRGYSFLLFLFVAYLFLFFICLFTFAAYLFLCFIGNDFIFTKSLSCFFLLIFLSRISKKNWQKFYCQCFIICFPGSNVTRIRLISLYTLAIFFIKVLLIVKFCLCEHDVPCALEVRSNSRVKRTCGILICNH